MDEEAPLLRAAVTFVRSLIFALLFYGLTIPLLLAATVGACFGSRAVAPVARTWARTHRVLARLILGQRVQIEGTLPKDAQFVVFKHESMFETLDAACMFNWPTIAAKRELVQIPVWGWVAHRWGLIPVDRKAGASALRAIRAQALAAMALGRTVVFFPEGTRVPHGQSPPLKAGFAGLYAILGVPVLPVAVDSGRLAPRNGFMKRPGTITYRVGALIPPGLPRAEAELRVHAAINALNDQPTADQMSQADSV